MANRFKGEVTVKAEGAEYTLRMDFNALAEFESLTGMNGLDWAQNAETGDASVRDIITMMQCCLLRHHPEASRRDAGDIISEDTGALMRLFQASAPTQKESPYQKDTPAGK
ncbi:hypothetical protein P775_14255 [Puniceibacterium antarcticum]|uniref:Gene transfer agent protein n=1 Tax=Puniceibacterium antarcticum TaxID=1206336 RepID=A0A2G8RDA9_9RHOB|nr:GTA-gp10 family protein [Puniceibacterium antarcticum]PIL19512.1 hypothetical protein P775_14255 [Puniceibacterium antarcticum]